MNSIVLVVCAAVVGAGAVAWMLHKAGVPHYHTFMAGLVCLLAILVLGLKSIAA